MLTNMDAWSFITSFLKAKQQKPARRDVFELDISVEYSAHPMLSVSFSFTAREAG